MPHLVLATAAIYAFSRFLAQQNPRWLYLAGLSLGLAFYAKEHSALLLPVFFLALLLPPYREWLKRPAPYVACAVWLLVVSPDLIWNARTDEEVIVNYAGEGVAQATYARHLQRIGGVGLSAYPSMFYARSVVTAIHQAALGRELRDETPEYDSINPLLGLVLVGAAVVTAVRYRRATAATPVLLLAFWVIFAFFTLIEKGNPPGRLDPVSWIWVEVTLIPATMLAGARLAGLEGRARATAWAVASAALLYACWPLLSALLGSLFDPVQEGFSQVSHALQVAAESTVVYTRARPLRAVAFGIAAGVVAGAVIGYVLGRRQR
ncbi:MAG: glycosyltransferase family 39 protein [Vicinamibacterales bacterium]